MILSVRALLGAMLYRSGLLSRGACFRWEMDAALREWSRKPTLKGFEE